MIPILPQIVRDEAGGFTDSGSGPMARGGSPFNRDILMKLLLGSQPKAVSSAEADAPTLALGNGGSVTTVLDLLIPTVPPVLK
jgi:hypothetical protein